MLFLRWDHTVQAAYIIIINFIRLIHVHEFYEKYIAIFKNQSLLLESISEKGCGEALEQIQKEDLSLILRVSLLYSWPSQSKLIFIEITFKRFEMD